MSLTGNLEDLPLLDILQIVSFSKKTGYLTIRHGGRRGRHRLPRRLRGLPRSPGTRLPLDPRAATLPPEKRDAAVCAAASRWRSSSSSACARASSASASPTSCPRPSATATSRDETLRERHQPPGAAAGPGPRHGRGPPRLHGRARGVVREPAGGAARGAWRRRRRDAGDAVDRAERRGAAEPAPRPSELGARARTPDERPPTRSRSDAPSVRRPAPSRRRGRRAPRRPRPPRRPRARRAAAHDPAGGRRGRRAPGPGRAFTQAGYQVVEAEDRDARSRRRDRLGKAGIAVPAGHRPRHADLGRHLVPGRLRGREAALEDEPAARPC